MMIRTLCKDGGRTYYEVLIGEERVFVGLKDECRRYARLHERKAAREVREAQRLRFDAFLRLLDGGSGRARSA
jgi:putative hemolysin